MKHKMIRVCKEKGAYKTDEGMFVEGYASIFGNVDGDGDVIVKGAFAQTITEEHRDSKQLGPIRFIRQHDANGEPLGVFIELVETDKGLWFKAKVDDTTAGRDAYNQFVSGSRDTFSIGYKVLDEVGVSLKSAEDKGYRLDGFEGKEVNEITQIELYEISAVLFAANTSARIGAKSMSMKTKAAVGDRVLFNDGDVTYTAEVLEVITEVVELDTGNITPEDGDPVLKVDIVVQNEDGEDELSGEIVYLLESMTVAEDAEGEVEGAAAEDAVEEAKVEPQVPAPRILAKPTAKATEEVAEAAVGTQGVDVVSAIKGLTEQFKTHLGELKESHTEEIKKLNTEINKVKSKQRPSVSLGAARTKGGNDMTVKTAFDAFAEFAKGKAARDILNRSVDVKGSHFTGIETKTGEIPVTTGDAGLAGQNVDRRGLRLRQEEPPMLRDLLRVVTTDKGSISYIEETGAATAVTTLSSPASASQKTVVVTSAVSFYVGQEIWFEPEGSNTRESGVIADISGTTITMVDDLLYAHAATAVVSSVTFKFTPETEIKPALNLGFKEKTTDIKTLAHWVPVTKQALDDIDMLRAYIEDRLINGLKRTEEYQILYGKGSAEELDGIANNSDVRDYAWSDGGDCDTKLDAIRRAITLASHSGLRPDAVVLSIDDWEDVELAKGQDGHYIYADVVSGTEQTRWGLRVFTSHLVPAGEAIVGAFREGATLWDREQISIAITDSHEDYFARNMYAIRAEERIGLSIEYPQAFVVVEFDEAPDCPCCTSVEAGDGGGN